MKKLFSIMSHLQTHYHFKLNFLKVDQDTSEHTRMREHKCMWFISYTINFACILFGIRFEL